MNELTYTPEMCTGDAREYDGSVTLRMPTYEERLRLRVELRMDDEKQNASEQLMTMLKHLPDRLVAVEVTRLADGFKFDSLETIQYETGLSDLISEACLKIVGKYQVGNGSTSS